MKEKQISVFLPNRPGELASTTSQLARFNVNIRAVSVSDGMDYGVARMIVNDIERACVALSEKGLGYIVTDVVIAEIPDRPGALSEVCARLAEAEINIRYVYATVTPGGGVAMAIFSTEDNDRADQMLS